MREKGERRSISDKLVLGSSSGGTHVKMRRVCLMTFSSNSKFLNFSFKILLKGVRNDEMTKYAMMIIMR